MATATIATGRTAAALLRDRTYGPFVIGKILSSCGNWIQQIAAAVLMFDLTRSASMVGLVSVLLFAAPLVLALWTGALTDRRDRRRLLAVARSISAAAVGALGLSLLILGTEGFGGVPVLLVAAGVMGLGHALSAPAMQALTPDLVPDEDLEQALALGSIAPSIARTVGPAMGAGLLLLGGPGLAFVAAALAHAVFVVALLFIRARTHARPKQRPSIFGGVRYVFADRAVALLLLSVALLGFGADPMITLTPSIADQLGGGEELVGLFAAMFGAGSVVVVVLFRQLRKRLSLRVAGALGFVFLAAGLAIAGLLPTEAGTAGGFFVAGSGFMMSMVSLSTRIQRRIPDELRGRVMALWGVAFLGSRPIAAPINGAMADLTSVQTAMLVAGAIVLLASLPALSRHREPSAGGPTRSS